MNGLNVWFASQKNASNLVLAQAKPWNHLGDIADAINSHAKENGYSVVEENRWSRCWPGIS